jgi:1-phosphofructokinase family hexose kinase
MALTGLGATPTWIGFAGGSTGNELLAGLRSLDIGTCAVPTTQSTRVNLEILDAHGAVTEILEPGGTIERSEWAEFQRVCARQFQRSTRKRIVIISGSQPPGVPSEASAALVKSAHKANCLAFIDSSGPPLLKALAAQPDFVKINREEAEFVTQISITDANSAAQAARKLLALGAISAAISLGNRGVVAVRKKDPAAFHAWTAPLESKSTVGCGDSTLAAWAFAMANDSSFEKILMLAVACGAANCLAPLPARIKRADVLRLQQSVRIERLSEKGDS